MPKTAKKSKGKKPAAQIRHGTATFYLVPKNRPLQASTASTDNPGTEVGPCDSGDCDCKPARLAMVAGDGASSSALGAVAAELAPHVAAAAVTTFSRMYSRPQVSRLRMDRTRDIADNASKYFGPIGPTDGLEHYAIQLGNVVAVTSSATGVMAAVFSSDPSTAPDWASYAAVFDEYRVLGIMVEYQPINRYAPVASPGGITVQVPWAVVIDYDDIAPLTTFGQAGGYGGSIELRNTTDPWKRVVRMSGGPDDNWVTTAAPAATFSVKTYGQGASNSIQYGNALVRTLVQFRTSD